MKLIHAFLFFLFAISCSSCQDKPVHVATTQYPAGYPDHCMSALQQLQSYPMPRYLQGNNLMRLYNWMDPEYMGGRGQPGIKRADAFYNAVQLQKELALEWNYGINLPDAGIEYDTYKNSKNDDPFIVLANEYPQIPLDVTTYWLEANPRDLGYSYKKASVSYPGFDSSFYMTYNFYGDNVKEIKYTFPDSLIQRDGTVQKLALEWILSKLTRPINRINENGEENPQANMTKFLKNDEAMVHMKDNMKIDSWEDFAAIRKLQMRNVYSSCFMKTLPGLQNTFFSFYTVEGGPIDRFKWSIMKKCMTPVNGIYYSTPDFYVRWQNNWKNWTGAWHGWKWIEIGRKTEIKDGDYLFSPFVAAGWDANYDKNVLPGQWLGLLKCLSVAGAEFYYVGYFNLKTPFTDPALYTWQAAMPAYAQAITGRFEDVLKNGNVLFDENGTPIISYPADDKHLLITARKSNKKQEYVIAATYQPFTNDSNDLPEKTNASVTIDGHPLSFEARKQGSVYVYVKTDDSRTIFYQLDAWHENAHPDHWSKDFAFEAEVADSGLNEKDIYTEAPGANSGDYTNFVSFIHLRVNNEYCYSFNVRDSLTKPYFIWFRYRGEGKLSIVLSNTGDRCDIKNQLKETKEWKWLMVSVPSGFKVIGNNSLQFIATSGSLDLDKFVVTASPNLPK